MTEQTSLVPNRRFKEFQHTHAWEQRKVIDIAPLQRGFDLPVREMEAGSYPVIMSNGIGAYHSKYKAKAPGVVTGRSGTIGNLTFVEVNYWPHNTALWVTDFKGNDAKFIYYLYQKLDLKRYGTGSGVPTLNRNNVHDTTTSIPSVTEQKQISRLFAQLDHLITLHQRKLEKTKSLKSAYLSEMFPAEGEHVPKRRFAGFTDAWEQRRLGEVTEVYDGTHQTPDYKDEGIMFLSVENIKMLQSDKYISEEAFENEFKVRPEKGDVLMTRIGDVGTANVVTSNEPIAYYVSLALLKKKDLNPYFLQASIHSSAVHDEIWKRTLHIAFPKKINKNEIEKVPINFPSEQEQEKIGLFFKELDHLITLHQRKLEKLQNLKKAFLNEMFV
jgi:type I restriction enzyme S subunit